jgi:hypothetical protein
VRDKALGAQVVKPPFVRNGKIVGDVQRNTTEKSP